jgi:hypothetical protein
LPRRIKELNAVPNRDKASDADLAPTGSTEARKAYTAPVLQRFGQLNRVTQGSGGMGNDGSFNMSMGGMGMGMGGGMGMGMM